MAKLYNLARMTTATTGTGTITLGSAVSSYLSFASSGVQDGNTVTYAIVDGSNREIGRGVYTASGTTLTRTVLKSTNSNTAISLSGTAEVFISPAAEDLANLGESNTFTANQIISVTDNTNAALRIEQLGTGNALLVQDSSNPDSTPVVITADGNMSIGATTATAKLEVIGGVANSITALGTEDAATLAVTNSDVSGLGRLTKTLYQIGNLSLAAVGAVYSAFNAGGDIGGDLILATQQNLAGGVVERLRINRFGSFGINGANYGTSGQFIKSAGSAAAPSWASIANTDVSGLGTMSTQNSNSVSITGGSITGITDLAVADGGTGASTLTGYVKGSGTAALTASATIPNTDITGLGTLSTQSGTFSGTSSGTNTGDQNLFSTIAVSGQSNVVADTTSDTLTLVAGTNVTITTDAATDSITIASNGGGMTLLGTITTTSGASQSLSSLTLTNYKQLMLVLQGVSHNSGSSQSLLVGTSTSDDIQVSPAIGAGFFFHGNIWIDLTNGSFSANTGGTSTATSASNTATSYIGDLTITTSSTVVSVAMSGGNFDAGSILVYGVK